MNTPFFITSSAPRCRTAWFANLFTTDTTLCFHEPKESIEELMAQYPQRRVGISSCMLGKDFEDLSERYPQAPWIYILRPYAETKASMLAFARGRITGAEFDGLMKAYFQNGNEISGNPKTLAVQIENINMILPQLWYHVLPEFPFDASRVHLLTELKVEQRLEQAFNRFAEGRKMLWPQ